MRLLLVLFLSHAAAANTTDATSEGCASALQMQDTVRSSLRSEDTARALRDLMAENRVALQQLKDAIDGRGSIAEKSTEALARATEKSAEAQARATEKSTEKFSALEKAIGELKTYGAILVLGIFVPSVWFIVSFPQRAISMLRAYIGQGVGGQHPPP